MPRSPADFVAANPRWFFTAADGRVFRLNELRPNPAMTGMVPDNATDSLPAILACLKYMETYFITNIDWPEGEYYCSSTIQFKQQVIINGPAGGQEPGVTGQEHNFLRFPASTGGFVFNRADMLDDAIVPEGGRADGSIIRGMNLLGGGGAGNTTKSGIKTNCRIKIEDCYIRSFAGHGIYIKGNGGGNANCWRIDTVRLTGNALCGLMVVGDNANAGLSTAVDASSNGQWGIYDKSFLGNRHDGFHMEGNVLGPWKTEENNAVIWMDGYTEPGQPYAQASPKTLSSGPQGVPIAGGAYLTANGLDEGGLGSSTGFYTRNVAYSGAVTRMRIGRPHDLAGLTNLIEIDAFRASLGESGLLRLTLHQDSLDFICLVDDALCYAITGRVTPAQFGTGVRVKGAFVLPSLYLGEGAGGRRQTYGSAAPTTGAHGKGEIVWNNGDNPAKDAIDYWRCSAAGTPGTWVARP